MKRGRRLLGVLAPIVGKWYLSFVIRTTKVEYRGWEQIERLQEAGQPAIFAFWHGRLALLAALRPGRPVYLMISRHGDGEIIARIAEAFNKPSFRGSTTRGGKEALRSLARLLRKGHDAGITPDGPRGPRQVCQAGVIALARMTEHPIVPASYSARRKRFLSSWDRFLFPYPFNRAVVVIGAPIEVERGCSKEEMELKRQELEHALNQLTEEADRRFQ